MSCPDCPHPRCTVSISGDQEYRTCPCGCVYTVDEEKLTLISEPPASGA